MDFKDLKTAIMVLLYHFENNQLSEDEVKEQVRDAIKNFDFDALEKGEEFDMDFEPRSSKKDPFPLNLITRKELLKLIKNNKN